MLRRWLLALGIGSVSTPLLIGGHTNLDVDFHPLRDVPERKAARVIERLIINPGGSIVDITLLATPIGDIQSKLMPGMSLHQGEDGGILPSVEFRIDTPKALLVVVEKMSDGGMLWPTRRVGPGFEVPAEERACMEEYWAQVQRDHERLEG